MKRNKFITSFLALTMVMSLLTGCGGQKKVEETKEKVEDKVEETKEKVEEEVEKIVGDQYFNTYLTSEPATLDTSKIADQYGNAVLYNIAEGLTSLEWSGEGQSGAIVPAGAESWDISDDGLTYTFHLRDAKWSDGEPITAQNYEYGIKRTINPETGSPSAYLLSPIKNYDPITNGEMDIDELGVKAIDEKTLEIQLDELTPYFLSLTYQNGMCPLREDYVEEKGDTYGSSVDTVLCNGPFIISEWVHNSKIELEKNPEYWDKDAVSLSKVTYSILDDENARHNSFENGSLDYMATTIEEWVDRFKAKDNVNFEEVVSAQVNYSFFNTGDDIFKNANIRKAFIAAMDREGFNDTLFYGYSTPAYGWIARNISVGDTEFRAVVDEPIKKLIADNPDPKELLLKGMEEEGLGDDPGALKVVWSFGGTSQRFRTIGEYIQQIFKQSLGVNLEIELNDWPIFQDKISTGEFQIGYMAWGAEYNDPDSTMSLLLSNSNALKTYWANDEYDALINEASSILDEDKRIELYKEAELLMLYEEGVVNPVIYSTGNNFTYDYVKGLAPYPFITQGFKHVDTSARP